MTTSTLQLPSWVATARPQFPPATILLIILILVGWSRSPEFLSLTNINSILFTASVLLPAVIGAQFLLVIGRFDLSLGATASLAGMITALSISAGQNIVLSVLIGFATGCMGGSLAGVLVAKLSVDPLIATLAMSGILRSIALLINQGRIVTGIPETFAWLITAEVGHCSVLVLFSAVLVLIAVFLTRHAVVFRRFYALGNNPVAASHVGISVEGLTVVGYAIAGTLAAATGIVQTARTLSASPLIFDTLPIEALTACILGGSRLTGGRGGVLGATVGLVLLVAADNLVVMLGISVYWKALAVGLLLLLAVLWSQAIAPLKGALARFATIFDIQEKT